MQTKCTQLSIQIFSSEHTDHFRITVMCILVSTNYRYYSYIVFVLVGNNNTANHGRSNNTKCQFTGNTNKTAHLKWLMNEVRNLSGKFTQVCVTTAMSLTRYRIIYAKTQQVGPELLRLLSQQTYYYYYYYYFFSTPGSIDPRGYYY